MYICICLSHCLRSYQVITLPTWLNKGWLQKWLRLTWPEYTIYKLGLNFWTYAKLLPPIVSIVQEGIRRIQTTKQFLLMNMGQAPMESPRQNWICCSNTGMVQNTPITFRGGLLTRWVHVCFFHLGEQLPTSKSQAAPSNCVQSWCSIRSVPIERSMEDWPLHVIYGTSMWFMELACDSLACDLWN